MDDPVVYAILAFLVFLGLELWSLRRLQPEGRAKYRGYERRDARTSVLMGLVSLRFPVVDGLPPSSDTWLFMSSRRCGWPVTVGTPG